MKPLLRQSSGQEAPFPKVRSLVVRHGLRKQLDRSLRQLGVDVIDHYQMHKPDPTTPIVETLGALQELIDAGKVREIGCSNFTADMLEDMVTLRQKRSHSIFDRPESLQCPHPEAQKPTVF